MGRGAGGSGGSPAWVCCHVIPFLIFPLGLSPTFTSVPHLPLSPPSFSLQCPFRCPVPSPSAEGTPWLALQVTGHGFGQGTPHVPGSFHFPVHQAPSTLHAGQRRERSTPGTPCGAAPHWLEHKWQTGGSSPATASPV